MNLLADISSDRMLLLRPELNPESQLQVDPEKYDRMLIWEPDVLFLLLSNLRRFVDGEELR